MVRLYPAVCGRLALHRQGTRDDYDTDFNRSSDFGHDPRRQSFIAGGVNFRSTGAGMAKSVRETISVIEASTDTPKLIRIK